MRSLKLTLAAMTVGTILVLSSVLAGCGDGHSRSMHYGSPHYSMRREGRGGDHRGNWRPTHRQDGHRGHSEGRRGRDDGGWHRR